MRVLLVRLQVFDAECVHAARQVRIDHDRVRDWFLERVRAHAIVSKSDGVTVGRATNGAIAVKYIPLGPP